MQHWTGHAADGRPGTAVSGSGSGSGSGAGDGSGRSSDTLGATLAFVDDAGVTWRVTEHDGRAVPGSRGPRYLRFTSDYTVRRIWDYPPDWRSLAPGVLAKVSWRR